jgi:hypothetical protein
VAGCCEHANEASGSIKDWEFLDKLSDWELFKEDSTPSNYLITFQFPVRAKSCLYLSCVQETSVVPRALLLV